MVLDSWRGRIVVFGGEYFGNYGHGSRAGEETFEWGGSAWSFVDAPHHPVGGGGAAAFDSARGRVVRFGGWPYGGSTSFDDTWEYDGVDWAQQNPAVRPGPRRNSSLVFDSVRNRIVLFGGYGGGLAQQETWEYDGATWSMSSPAVSPPGRGAAAMAFDASIARTVLFGGANAQGGLGDTWEWDGVNWTQGSTGPAARAQAGIAYDSARARIVLVGGTAPFQSIAWLQDTWERTGGTWTLRNPGDSKVRRISPGVAFDPSRGQVVMFGGGDVQTLIMSSNVLAWNGSTWTQVQAPEEPGVNNDALLVPDPSGNGVLLLGILTGNGNNARTMWRWSGSSWSKLPAVLPVSALGPATTDPVRQCIVLFDAYGTGATWEWNGTAWQQKATSGPGANGSMAFHTASGRVVFVGGVSGRETWEWDGQNWSQRSPATQLSGGGVLGGDPLRGVVVLKGGAPGNETWEWDGVDWHQRFPASAWPTHSGALTYDPTRQRMILYSGGSGATPPTTWEWDGNIWRDRGVRWEDEWGTVAYDAAAGETIGLANRTWRYGPLVRAEASAFGSACGVGGILPTIATRNGALPWLGDLVPVDVDGTLPSGAALLAMSLSNANWSGGALPQSLMQFGMPSCSLLVGDGVTLFLAAAGTTATVNFAVPGAAAFLGMHIYLQGFPLVPGANAAGVTATAGLALRFGAR